MAHSQNLLTNIIINAKTGSGFSQVGSVLAEMGSIVNGISQELISFGKDSVEVYKDYEKSMSEAEVALSTTYGRGTRQLSTVMENLDKSASQWAASTIFHTDDVAAAISNAAHAGWDYDQIITGIPAAMQLAQAGSLDLSDAVDYITKATHAAGVEFDDLGDFVDHWTYAANRSATDIEGMGDAMLRMGNTMEFAGGTDELLVMLAELANAGTTGSDAGTLLRNSMLRLVSPTKKARDVMEDLGAESEEIEEILSDEALAAANAELATRGFSAYDDQGNLKSMLDIFTGLNDALEGMTEEEKNNILSSIFPTRSITGAKALLKAASEEWHGLYDELTGGNAEDYGEFAMQRMGETLYGQIELFDSKVEALKQKTGATLSEDVESALSGLGGFIDSLTDMDTGTFGALVSGLEVVALAGPGIIGASTALRFLGTVLTPGGAIALGATALIALATALQELDDFQYHDKFGDLELDMSEMETYLSGLHSGFQNAQAEIDRYREGLRTAVSEYNTASSELKGKLLELSLTETELTPETESALMSYGEQISNAVINGITNNYDAMAESIANAFAIGDLDGESEEDIGIQSQIMSVLELGFENNIAKAQELSQELRDALTSAFTDGHLTSEEVANIQSIMDEQNALMAAQMDRENYLERQRSLRKAQSLGLEGVQQISGMAEEIRDSEYEALMEQQEGARYDTGYWYDQAIANGWMIPNTDGTPGEHAATEADKAQAMAMLESNQANERAAYTSEFNRFIGDLYTETIKGSELSDAWDSLQTLAADFRASGGIVTPEAAKQFNTEVNADDATDLSRFLNTMVDSLGGYDMLADNARYFSELGDEQSAAWYRNMMDMYEIMGDGWTTNPEAETRGQGDYSEVLGSYDQMSSLLQGYAVSGDAYKPEELVGAMHDEMQRAADNGFDVDWDSFWHGTLGEGLYNAMNESAEKAGYDSITDWVNEIDTQLSQEEIEIPAVPVVGEDPIPIPIEPVVNQEDAASELADQGVDVTVNGDTQELQATIAAEDGQDLLTYVNGDAENLHSTIMDENGQVLWENVNGNVSALRAAIQQFNGQTITVNIRGNKMFASGGRATTASIFGEAGPEWAIPEEHTQRTAELLNAAREASGFTWPELLGQFGGMNADSSHTPSTIVYSPVINSSNSGEIEQILRDDKERLRQMLREERLLQSMEVYA